MRGRRRLADRSVRRVVAVTGLCGLLALAAGCVPVTADPPPPPAPPAPKAVTNLGFAGGRPATDGQYVAFAVPEASQGTDLNSDGDTNDDVVHVWSRATGVTTDLGLAVGPEAPLVSQGLVAFAVSESDQGVDLNGDADTNDNVVRVWFGSTGLSHNLGVAGRDLVFDQGVLAFRTPESAFGLDLNGDLDTNDQVVQVWNANTDAVANLSLASNSAPLVSEHYVGVAVSEAGQGLDSDGDTLLNSDVPAIYNADTTLMKSSGLPLSFPSLGMGGSVLGFLSGSTMRAFNLNDSATPTDLGGVSVPTPGVGGGSVAFVDVGGHYQVWSAATNAVTPLGLAAASPPVTPVAKGGLVVLLVSEAGQSADLNGDGDQTDSVFEIYNGSANTTTNLGIADPATHLGFFAGMVIGDGNTVAMLGSSGGGQEVRGVDARDGQPQLGCRRRRPALPARRVHELLRPRRVRKPRHVRGRRRQRARVGRLHRRRLRARTRRWRTVHPGRRQRARRAPRLRVEAERRPQPRRRQVRRRGRGARALTRAPARQAGA